MLSLDQISVFLQLDQDARADLSPLPKLLTSGTSNPRSDDYRGEEGGGERGGTTSGRLLLPLVVDGINDLMLRLLGCSLRRDDDSR